jgi:hypothetical protein
VRIQEEAIAGPGRLVPRALMDVMLHWRNAETLHRLAYLAEGRAAPVEYVVSSGADDVADGPVEGRGATS